MPWYKNTWQFTGPRGVRFSEVYYSFDPSIAAASDIDATSAIVKRRLAFLHPLYKLKKIVLTAVTPPREKALVNLGLSGVRGFFAGIQAASLPANFEEAAVWGLAGTVGSRKVWFRGLAETAVATSEFGNDVVSPAMQRSVDKFIEAFPNNNYGVLSRMPPGDIGTLVEPYKRKVTAIAANADPKYTDLTLAVAMAMPTTRRLVIGGANARQYPGLNGQHDIINIAGLVVTMRYKVPLAVANLPVTGMYAYPLEYAPINVAEIDPNKCAFAFLASRQTKNADTNSRGSRRVVRGR